MPKKKTKLKPVVRPFATTSIPSTSKKTASKEATPPPDDPSTATSKTSEVSDGNQPSAPINNPPQTPDPLQPLLEIVQPRVEKEINRILKTYETDYRFSNSEGFQTLSINSSLLDSVFTLYQDEYAESPRMSFGGISEQKLLQTLAITYGVLHGLGFDVDLVTTCLGATHGVSLDEALEWLFLNCSEEQLNEVLASGFSPNRAKTSIALPSTVTTASSNTPDMSNKPSRESTPPLPASLQKSSAKTGTLITPDVEDPNVVYAAMQLKIDALTTHRQPGEKGTSKDLAALRLELKSLEQHLLFKPALASSHYAALRREADDRSPSKTSPVIAATDVFSEDSEDEGLGGFLGILEEPTPGTGPGTGRTVTIREMPLGKSQSSLPRSILERHLAKVDTRTSVSFHSSSIGFRAFRAEATLHQAGRKHRWDMPENVACPEDLQAVHYVALVVLHYLTTSSDAATPFLKTTKSAPGFLAQFPPSFRELWDDLEVERQANADLGNRNMWDSLKDVLQVKLDQDLGKVTAKKANPKEPSDKTPSRPSEPSRQISPEFLHGLIAERHSRLEYQTMLRQRLTLPIAQERDNILRHLEDHQVLVVCGATGSGKSTQLPTYILENELTGGRHCHVICTEPRRISAVSLAKRCSVELGESHDAVGTSASLIGYSIRLENRTSSNTRLVFMTNGIAVRMLSDPHSLDEVTHLIIDEVHERSVEVDFLLLTLRTMLKTRPNLKVILMSATADADRISQYFGFAPTLYIPGRTFPVEPYFLEDAVQETGWTIDENSPFARRDGKVSQELIDFDEASVSEISGEVRLEKKYSPQTVSTLKLLDDRLIPFELVVKLMETLCLGKTPKHASVLIFLPGLREILSLADALESHPMFSSHIFKIFLLHSALSNDTQNTVFDTLPEGMVKIVLATNIAETGITISDITCVIDTCRHREMRYQRQTNRLLEMFISKANALQRRGRAGRVRPGECYHLCTKERFNKMAEHPVPEILRVNLTDVALRIKSLSIDLGANSIADALSQALEPPPLASIQKAVATLLEVGALTTTEDLTSLGRRLAQIPADIHLSKLFIAASLLRCLDPALTVGAVLASKSPFVAPLGQEKQADAAKASFKRGESDFLTFHNAFASWRRACANGVSKQFCRANYLNEQTLTQLEELRQQFFGYLVDAGVLHVEKSSLQEFKRAQAMRGRRGNRVHFFNLPSTLSEYSDTDLIVDAALTMGLYPRLLKLEGNTMRTITNNQTVQFHPSSVHPRWMTDVAWNYFTYFTLTQSQNKRVYAAESGPGNDLALILLCGDPEFKLVSGAALSGKIRFKASPKVMVALKILRDRLDASLSAALRNAANLTTRHEKWLDITCRVLGNIRRNLDVEKETIAIR